jgi:hypothetical protein
MSFVASAIIGADASEDAAEIQAQSAREAQALQEKMYNQQRSDYQPWRDAGGNAIGKMQDADFQRDFTMNDFQQDPGYAFRMQEGQKALERSNLAKFGGGLSGGQLKALGRYGQDMGAQEYQSAYNRFNADRDRRFGRLSQISGQGLQAVGGTSGAAQNYANQAGQHMIDAGNAQAAGEMGAAGAWTGALGKIGEVGAGIATGGLSALGGGGGGGNWMQKTKANYGRGGYQEQ